MIKRIKELFIKYHKKSIGFTLVELLAVIVVLAIIALIGYMVVGPIIESSKNSANERNVENFEKALEEQYFIIVNVRNETVTSEKLYNETVENFSGNPPITSDDIVISEGKVSIKDKVTVGDSTCSKTNTSWKCETTKEPTICSVTKGTGENYGDEITCGTESFYVLATDNTTITMLAKYNLMIDFIIDSNAPFQNSSEESLGIWTTKGYPNVEGDTLNVDYWNNKYLTYLKNTIGMDSATTISIPDDYLLKCNTSTRSCSGAPSWVYSVPYWIDGVMCGGTSSMWCNQYVIKTDGTIGYVSSNAESYGARPVVTMLKTDLSKKKQ